MTNDNLHRLLSAAADAHRNGRTGEAASLASRALAIDSTCIEAQFILGVTNARLGQVERAAEYLGLVLRANPTSYEALMSLSTVYREAGRIPDAIELAIRAVQAKPGEVQALNNLGRCFLAQRRLEEAASVFIQAINMNPRFVPAYYNLGKTRQLEGREGEAANAFGMAAQMAPTTENLLSYGQLLLSLCEFDGALRCGQKCVEQSPESAAAHLLLCGALSELKQTEEAERHLQRAIELDPDGVESMQTAVRQRPLGHIEEANENLRRAIRRDPRQIAAYDALMQNQRVTERDRCLVDQLEAIVSQSDLSTTEAISAHYGLGKSWEDLGDFALSMRHYDEANRLTRQLKFGDLQFDREAYAGKIDRWIKSFPTSASVAPAHSASRSEIPLLVIGMMRSGTTLTEQILSSHSSVAPGGEHLFWSRNWSRAFSDRNESMDIDLGGEYVDALSELGPEAQRVTDKMPGNYMFAGLIHRSVPNARIIHIRRSPIDTCLSIWATPNHMPHEGGHVKSDIVFVYRQYLRLMAHWRAVLPPNRFLEIDYESLVSNREETTRSMLDFAGLSWEDQCLRPEDNSRLVLTPSAWQVRQPVYKTSVERWRRFEPFLGDFKELLEL